MKDKLKTRIREFKNDPLFFGVAIGTLIGSAGTLVVMSHYKVGFIDTETLLHIPDVIVDEIVETGLPVLLTRHDGVQLAIGLS